jgi:surface antigen
MRHEAATRPKTALSLPINPHALFVAACALVVLAVAVCASVLVSPSHRAGASIIGNNYPSNLATAGKDSLFDPWGFYNRECTSFVAWRLNSANGIAFKDFYGGPQWGNAENWGPTAKSLGIPVNGTPAVGAVAWDAGGVGGASSEGHVAWVANIEANGSIDVEEYNYAVSGAYDVRTGLSPSSFSGFIHIADIGKPPQPVTPASTGAPSNPPPPGARGYWLVGSDGGVFSFGASTFYGSTGSVGLQRPVVAITPTADRGGYWLVASDGGTFSFGDSNYFGSIPGIGLAPADSSVRPRLNAPILGMVPSSDGQGYFLVGSDGGVFAFGDATFQGSCPGIGGCLTKAVAVVPDATGKGYWLITQSGGVYIFGDATYYGGFPTRGGVVTSAVRTPDGGGYWVLSSNGTIGAFGDATTLGSPAIWVSVTNPATAIFATSDGGGYWVAAANGAVYNYGDAPDDGGMNATKLNGSIIAGTGF